jgi:hypothetical protein
MQDIVVFLDWIRYLVCSKLRSKVGRIGVVGGRD